LGFTFSKKGMKSVYFLALVLSGVAWFTEGQNIKSSQVTLSLAEFEELFSSARLEEAERRLMDQRKRQEAEHKKRLADIEKQLVRANEETRKQRNDLFPNNYQVLRHTAEGVFNSSAPASGVEKDVASFDLELMLRVMESRWTVVPISNNTSVVASNWDVSWRNENDGVHEFDSVDPVTCPDVMLLVKDEQQILATNRSGLFKVKFKAYTRVAKSRNLNTVGIKINYPISEFKFRIAAADAISVRDFSVQPTSAVLEVQHSEEYTDMKATLPLTADSVTIKWLDVSEEDIKDSDTHLEDIDETLPLGKNASKTRKGSTSSVDYKPQVTATHEALHTVGEGILRSFHVLEYATTSDMSPLNSVQFLIHGIGARITSVVGHGLQSWTAEDSDDLPSSKLVRANFKSSHLDSTVTLLVHTELDRNTGPITDQVELPRIECKNVLRQVGQVAVIKDANVEVHESKSSGLSRCEPTEISSQLRLNLDRPIVLSYKYLNPNNLVILDVSEHTMMDTLEATIDRVHYKALVTDSHTVHSTILVMQSTKLQYLELLNLPPSSGMFTVMVNSIPTKPVEGRKGNNSIMIPLLIGLDPETANEGGNMRTSVEIDYISTHDDLGQNGTLQLAPPQFNLPISVLTSHLRLPETYEYEFSGDFGNIPSKKLAYPIPSAFSYKTGTRVVHKDYKFSAIDDAWPEDKETKTEGTVKIITPKIGQSFHFHRLLVVNNSLFLNATYSRPLPPVKSSWW